MLQRKGPELVLVTTEPPTMRESVPQSPPRGQAQSNLQTPSLEKTLSLCEADSAPCGKEGDQNHSRRGMGSRDSKSENSCTSRPEHPGAGSLKHRKGLLLHGQGLCRERQGLGGTLAPPARSQ